MSPLATHFSLGVTRETRMDTGRVTPVIPTTPKSIYGNTTQQRGCVTEHVRARHARVGGVAQNGWQGVAGVTGPITTRATACHTCKESAMAGVAEGAHPVSRIVNVFTRHHC